MPACECALCMFLCVHVYIYMAVWLYPAYLKMCAQVCACAHVYACRSTDRETEVSVKVCLSMMMERQGSCHLT